MFGIWESVLLFLPGSALLVLGMAGVVGHNRNRRLRPQRRRLRQMADMATQPVMICDGERILVVNNGMRELFPPRKAPEGRLLSNVLDGWTVQRIPSGLEVDATLDRPGGPVPVRLSRRTILFRDRPHYVITVDDGRDRQEHQAELARLQRQDALTGLANRQSFQAALAACFAPGGGQAPRPFALLLVGLDRFTAFNEIFGHAAGDDLLRRAAHRLQAMQPGVPVVGRLGGDQFALLLPEADPGRLQALGTAVIAMLTSWLRSDPLAMDVGASAGFAVAPSDAADEEALGMAAELALRGAKQAGRGICRGYRTGLAEEARERHRLEVALRRALACNQLAVHYQPQVDLRTGAFDGAEALLRWRHPERGVIEPNEFLPIAEEIGLIGELGEWVLRTACSDASGWPEHLRVAVNLSAAQLGGPDLAEAFAGILAETGFAPERLELEVTESVLIRDETRTSRTLNQLRGMGIRVALDDFGTGYSSLSYLRRFPFDKIKLDKSFISRAPDDPGDGAIVTAILTLARSLGMETTAEGIETEAQATFAAECGCNQAQGFLIGHAVPDQDLPAAFHHRPEMTATG